MTRIDGLPRLMSKSTYMSEDFTEFARKEAIPAAQRREATGEQMTDGALVIMDPRGGLGALLAPGAYMSNGYTKEGADREIANLIADTTRNGHTPAVILWQDSRPLRGILVTMGTKWSNDQEKWAGEIDTWLSPVRFGFVRVAAVGVNGVVLTSIQYSTVAEA